MTKWEKILAEREAKTLLYDARLRNAIKVFQGLLWGVIADKLIDFAYDSSGGFKFTVSNQTKVSGVKLAIEAATKKEIPGFLRGIVRNIIKIIGLNKGHFKEVSKLSNKEIDELVLKLVLQNYGYDLDKKQLIKGGWLSLVTDTDSLGSRVAQQIAGAIRSRISLKQFREQFKDAFTGKDGEGYLENQYQAITYDLYAQVDRTTQLVYAEKLGLDHAYYSGTVMARTRPFCAQRSGNVYTVVFIEKWKDLEFQGKYKVGYDPFIHCGGHNCRHHLSYMDAAFVEAMGYPVNVYSSAVVLA